MARSPRLAAVVPNTRTIDTPVSDEAKPENPVQAAARLLLARALKAAGSSVKQVGGEGIVCLIRAPAADWTRPARDAWSLWVRGGQRSCDGQTEHHLHYGEWVAWTPTEQPEPYQRGRAAEVFADAIAAGRHCVGFALDPDWLPRDLVQAADYRLEMPVLTGKDVGLLAASLCGGKAKERLSDEQAATLTPRLLRLARRPSQVPDDYLLKLRDLLIRDQATRATAALPAAPPLSDTRTLDRLHGMDEAVAWGMAVARDLAAYREKHLPWEQVDGPGCLLSGPPGCGKTLFARAFAATCNVPLITGSWGKWQGTGSGHQGDFLKAMRSAFVRAKEKAATDGGAILFIDEVDSFPNRETVTHHYKDYEIQVVNALLAEIDGVEGRNGVVLLAACNHPHLLDPALTRAGRLERHIHIGLPDETALAGILREHLGAELADESLREAALATAGASGADCARIVRGARRRAREAERALVLADLLDEIRGTDNCLETEIRLAAVHEAGHAVAACVLKPGTLRTVSLLSARGSGGAVIADFQARYLLREDVSDLLVVLLSGRAAEEQILGEPSSGAGGSWQSDLARATRLASEAVSCLGFDKERGLLWSGSLEAATLPTVLREDPVLAAHVREMLAEAYARAQELVRAHQDAVTAISQLLAERRVLDGPATAEIVLGQRATA